VKKNRKKNTKKPIVVYWSPDSLPSRQGNMVLLDMKPIPLMNEIRNRRMKNFLIPPNPIKPLTPGNYQLCAALHTLVENMFVIKAPFDADIRLMEDGSIDPSCKYADWFGERIPSIENTFSIDFDYSSYFFSEEPLIVELTPPYMHQTSQPEYGFLSSAQMDISSWFRGFVLIYQLWENKRHVTFKAGEPIAYLNFKTDRPIIFKEFKVTEELLNLSFSCTNYKNFIPFIPMEQLYELFNKTSMKKRVLEEIKKNLV
jgi:hypothetical protein